MQLHQIRYFLELSNSLHFRKAAKSLGVSQPSLTKAIQALERELGGELMTRRRAKMQVTDLGRVVLPPMAEAVRSLDQAAKRAGSFVKDAAEPIDLVVSEDVDFLLDTSVMTSAAMLAVTKGAKISISVSPQSEAVRALDRGLVDAALLASGDMCDPFECTKLADDELVIVVPPSHALSGRREVPVDVLALGPFVEREGLLYERELTDIFIRAGLPRDLNGRVDDERSAVALVQAGVGSTAMTERRALTLGLPFCTIEGRPLIVRSVLALPKGRNRARSSEIIGTLTADASARAVGAMRPYA